MKFSWRDLHIRYINLAHRTDREAHMQHELTRIGLPAERFEAIKTKDLSWNRHPYKTMYNRTPGAIGCMLSQMAVMQEAYEQGKGAMVLEDDTVFASDTIKRLDYIEHFINNNEISPDIFFLGGTVHVNPAWWHKRGHDRMLQMCNCTLDRDMERIEDKYVVRVYGMFSTHAYFVPYAKIPKILGLLNQVMDFSIGIDYSLILHQPILQAYAFLPGTVKQLDNQSDIGNGMTIFSGFSMLGAHWWQDKMEDFNPDTYIWNEAKKQ